jgi:NitT/TauT family transport system substrate-binding protein
MRTVDRIDRPRWRNLPAMVAGLALLAVSCSSATGGTTDQKTELRLGYFPNLTHAAALVGVAEGTFADALGPDVTLTPTTFAAGPEAVEALLSGRLDAGYIGPNPAINAFATSDGAAIRIVSGATSGGAFLVVRKGIAKPADLEGATLASPQLGNTQDVALRSWLADQGFETDRSGGGEVSISNLANPDALASFIDGAIDGAWLPEPYATRMVREGKGHVLVDEADLWPQGRYVTTHLIVRTAYLEEHPDVVKGLIVGHLEATTLLQDEPGRAKRIVNEHLTDLTGSGIDRNVLDEAWGHLEFTLDPIANSLLDGASDAEAVDLLEPVDLTGIYDLTILNGVLSEAGLEVIAA